MVRKYILFLLIPFFFFGCKSKPLTHYYPTKIAVIPENTAPDPRMLNPHIVVNLSDPDCATITVGYSAQNWAFINAIELKNADGEILKYSVSCSRKVGDRGWISEVGSVILMDWDLGGEYTKQNTRLREFLAVGDITARPIADNEHFSFMPVVFD